MPIEAKPHERAGALPGVVPYRREYRDPLGRPMNGEVTITGTARTAAGDIVVVPVYVSAELVDGVLEVHLMPDTYTITASLRSVDGARTSDTDTITLT